MINSVPQVNAVSFTAHKSHTHTKKQHFSPITVTNFHFVDDTLMRGAKPNSDQLKELKNNGVKHVISFCTNYNPKTKTQGTLPDEAAATEKLGMKFHWLPFKSNDNPPEETVNKFFDIINKAKENGEKVYIHCRHGADRTGLFTALYRVKYQDYKLSEVVRELMAHGHDANHNPNIIPYIIDFKENQSFINKLKNFILKLFK